MSILRSRVPPPRSLARLPEKVARAVVVVRQRISGRCAAAVREEPAAHDRAPAPGAADDALDPRHARPRRRLPRTRSSATASPPTCSPASTKPTHLGVSLGGNTPLICTRAKLIDDAARAFLAAHDEAVVLHLGCGLDRPRPAPRPRAGGAVVRRRPGAGDRAAPAAVRRARGRLDDRRVRHRPHLVVGGPRGHSPARRLAEEGLLRMYLDPEGVHTAVTGAARCRRAGPSSPTPSAGRGHPGRGLGSRRCGPRTPASAPRPRTSWQRSRRAPDARRCPSSTPPRPAPAGSSRRPSGCSHWSPAGRDAMVLSTSRRGLAATVDGGTRG